MNLALSVSPHGRLFLDPAAEGYAAPLDDAVAKRVEQAFARGQVQGLFQLATAELQANLPPAFQFARSFGGLYLTQLCQTPVNGGQPALTAVAPPKPEELDALAQAAPPIRGLEYLNGDVLRTWWRELDDWVRRQVREAGGSIQQYLQRHNRLRRTVGRVTFHLAENKRDPEYPFAFLASYTSRLSAEGQVQHLPLGRALEEYAGAGNRSAMLSLLQPIQRAGERLAWVKEMVESREIYQPLAWQPHQAYRFLESIPALEESGLIIRVPDWWKAGRPPRPVVSVTVGNRVKAGLGMSALLDFSAELVLEGERLSAEEMEAIRESSSRLVLLKGKWVEVDREKLAQALDHWKRVERGVRGGGITFAEGMRLLSGANLDGDAALGVDEDASEWVGITAGKDLARTLGELRDPAAEDFGAPSGLRGELRPYQIVGLRWLWLLARLGLGACLADDMGLGKTVQVIALLLRLKQDQAEKRAACLLVVPASLIANWKVELGRFAPSLSFWIAHPSESDRLGPEAAVGDPDLVITTYGMLGRLEWLRRRAWKLVILDEAQAIKNSGTRQARAVKDLSAEGRIALTGTPVENRLSDLWSLFDFLNPGLLGTAKTFAGFARQLAERQRDPYGPLRSLVRLYILRRLKTDKRVIADLPEKTEINAYCGLSKRQAALYEHSVRELADRVAETEGIERRGIVLSYLMRLKQICNHPAQFTGDGGYEPERSGKFLRLAEICRELSDRQEKALVFTQFREIAGPLADFLARVFGRPGLVLHGGTPVGKRRSLVEAFQRDDGPPFFVLSLKAGGSGLNLTAASQVIHFDRWWNPAVENQATDRAFRIGQQRNVLVHKFVCRGTVEDKIDEMIAQKTGLSRDLLDAGGETLLTEMNNEQLLRFVALDVRKAMGS